MAGVGSVVMLPARLLRVSGGRGWKPGLSSSTLGVESQPGLSAVAGEAQPRLEGLGLPAASGSGATAAAAAAGLRLQGCGCRTCLELSSGLGPGRKKKKN
jgi:hypothetical protein